MIKQWEYLAEDYSVWPGDSEITAWLNEKGKEGWELLHVSYSLRTYFFKRPKRKETPNAD